MSVINLLSLSSLWTLQYMLCDEQKDFFSHFSIKVGFYLLIRLDCYSHINRLEKKNCTIISIIIEKVFENIQHQHLKKTQKPFSKLGIDWNFFNLLDFLQKIVLTVGRLKAFIQISKQEVDLSSHYFSSTLHCKF